MEAFPSIHLHLWEKVGGTHTDVGEGTLLQCIYYFIPYSDLGDRGVFQRLTRSYFDCSQLSPAFAHCPYSNVVRWWTPCPGISIVSLNWSQLWKLTGSSRHFLHRANRPCHRLVTQETRWCHNSKSRFNTLRPRQNGRHFADDIFKCVFLNENASIVIKISLNFVPKGPIYNIPALVQIMAWRRSGDKPLSEPVMVSLPTHICVTLLRWVNGAVWHQKAYEVIDNQRNLDISKI